MKKMFLITILGLLTCMGLAGCLGAEEIYDDAQNIANDTTENMENMENSLANSQYAPYMGESVNGTRVKSLIKLVEATNSMEGFEKIDLICKNLDGNTVETSSLDTSKKHKVEVSKYTKDGAISEITITELPE